jgi:ATPase subunit of ABC transporter with duplicated ATPase domains
MGRLRLEAGDLSRWATLSPGERKRWQLAAALARAPDILLLDEPTNHLDSEARRVVVDTLARFHGVGLVISHDRSFLDALTVRTLRVLRGKTQLTSGPYSVARKEWEAEESLATELYEEAKRREKALRRRLADERRDAEKRKARFGRTMREADPSDHDATSLAAKSRHAGGEASGSQRRSATRSELEQTARAVAELGRSRSIGGEIFFDYEPAPKSLLVGYRGVLRHGEHVVTGEVDVAIERKDRIRLTGLNGAGKSTLLRTIADAWSLPGERLLYLPQELSRDDGTALLRNLDDLSEERRGRVLAVVALLGVEPRELIVSRRPSPGEARKLALALGLGRNSWCLLLDEPTNHLDVDAVERVERALDAYPGALVVVTHDDSFASATTTTHWHLENGKLSTA